MLMALPLLLLLAASESLTATTTGGGGCPASCGGVDIPYPFGISPGCFRKGFEIGCSSKDGPVLAGTPLRVVHLSVDPDESLVMLPMGWKCYNASSPTDAVGSSYGETTMNKEGVYRISHTHNMLVVNGCNTMGYTASTATEGGASAAYAYYTGCMSYCNNSASAQDGLCSGVGCCHVDIPPGLTHNYFKFSAYSHENMMEYSPCDYAFLVDRTNYTFRRSDLKMDTNRTSPVWLDWAIRGNGDNDTHLCKQAAAATDQYACVSAHSDCIDSTNGPGYNCKCSKGYKGNAYIVQGCTNIDECADPGKYPCKGVCTDTNGSYQCECPPGYRSYDPITERCTPKFPLAAQISVGAIGGLLVLAFLAFIVVLRKEKQKAKDFYRKNGGLTLENARSIKIYTKDELKPVLKSSNLIGKKATELFDESIATTDDLEFLDKLAKLAMECLNLDADQRPSMTDVAERLLILHRSRKQKAARSGRVLAQVRRRTPPHLHPASPAPPPPPPLRPPSRSRWRRRAALRGSCRHSRRRPAGHAFEYAVRCALIDLDLLPLPGHLYAADARVIASTSGPV
ncbi:hypothetical protein ZWY2020_054373 [Hordeum vulgare]|nr:hypothetical protein ZWY2020_054373 [Hordeum vulgare]